MAEFGAESVAVAEVADERAPPGRIDVLGAGLHDARVGMAPDEERRLRTEITGATAAGRRPEGWMGPGLPGRSTPCPDPDVHTPALLAGLGYGYVLDWANDDQPYRLKSRDAERPVSGRAQ